MARAGRRLAAGGVYHVINRGALRQALFASVPDCRLFVGTLRDALALHPVGLLGWCLMPNHWHLLLMQETADALPRFMRWLTLAHSHRWQALHARQGQGTLYQGRYHSVPVANDAHLLTVLRYVERNPVRAGLVPSAASWAWSSLRERLEHRGSLLAPLPVALPEEWLATVNRPQTPAEEAAARPRSAGYQVRLTAG
ncbi:transposase [Geminicoccaceae bacterium 1502E]|nr:transposase [Geminicoccaceae bacterium 1502E]